jgi:hypothetical protein
MNGMDEFQAKENARLAGPPNPESPAALQERIAELQYEAGMYQSLYEVAVEAAEQLRRDLDHAIAMKAVWMNRALKAEALSPADRGGAA